MDVLKRKRQQLDADFGGRRVLRRAEIEAREIQRLRVAERQRLVQKRRKEEQLRSHPAASSFSIPPAAAVADEVKAGDRAEGFMVESLRREEVIRLLRLLRQPATLFGEDDAARLRRLHDALQDPAEIGEVQTNDFLRDIHALRLRAKATAKPKAVAAERGEEKRRES
ncbi:hypothetical protein ZWY2020_053814 [Hordeum vulgare]|nr:hypothetical protein ZWY2020_053814 [Hordeum vulgare]